MPKRPIDPSDDSEDEIVTGRHAADEPPAEEGATAFVRVDRRPPPQFARSPKDQNSETQAELPPADEAPGATAFVRVDQAPQDPNAATGATAFVRVDGPPKRG